MRKETMQAQPQIDLSKTTPITTESGQDVWNEMPPFGFPPLVLRNYPSSRRRFEPTTNVTTRCTHQLYIVSPTAHSLTVHLD